MMTVPKKSVKVGKFVSTAHVETVRNNYKKERWIHNSKRIGKADSLSVWFSLEDIESFLEKLKMHGGDGVRFYFGAYDESFAEKPLYAGRQTVVMVATKEKQTADGELNKDIYTRSTNGETNILAYNVGRPCPPFCQGTDDFDNLGIYVDKSTSGLVV